MDTSGIQFWPLVSINAGIRDAYENGILRSASLMAATERTSTMRQARSESFPVSGWGFICPASANGPSRRLTNSAALLTAMGGCPLPTRILPAAICCANSRLAKCTGKWRRKLPAFCMRISGLPDLDSHQHVHLMPGVFDLTLDLAEAYKIRVAPPIATGNPYHRTQSTMISWSKCRSLKSSCAEVSSVIAGR